MASRTSQRLGDTLGACALILIVVAWALFGGA